VITPVDVPTTVNNGDSGTAQWTVTYDDGSGFISCFSQDIFADYACVQCPTVTEEATMDESLCTGTSPNFTALTDAVVFADAANVAGTWEWFSDNTLSTPLLPTDYVYSGDNCAPYTVTIYAGLPCTLDNSVQFGGAINLTIYPNYDINLLTIEGENCTVPAITTTCDNYIITPISVPTDVPPGSSGVASWEIT
jgi:hypothetical protein